MAEGKTECKREVVTPLKKKAGVKSTAIKNCPHVERKHYAKKMCYICYIKHGRTKKAWKCKHPDRVLYAKGMCKSCYLKHNVEVRVMSDP